MTAAPPALAVHPGALGDVLLAVPALRALGRDGAPVWLAAQPRLGALLAALGVVARHLDLEALGLDALFVDDDARRPRLPPVGRLVCWLGARDPLFGRRLRALVPDAVVAPSVAEGRLVWEHLLATVGAPPGDWRAPLALPEALRRLGGDALAAAGWDRPSPLLFVHPGAGSARKRWPGEAFARVIVTAATRARIGILVHQGPADSEAAAAVRRHVGSGVVWLVEPSLPALAGALGQAAVFVGTDSGVSHLAAALGVPSVVLFEAANLAWRPWVERPRLCTVTPGEVREDEVGAVMAEVEALLG